MPTSLTTSTGKKCYWLLDVVIGGASYSYSNEAIEVTDQKGVTQPYFSGLDDLVVTLDEAPLSVSVTLPGYTPDGVAWSLLIARGGPSALGSGTAVLRRLYAGQLLEAARVIIQGVITDPEYGSIEEELSFTIERVGDEETKPFPPASAVIDGTTWPVTAGLTVDPSVRGAVYPQVFGFPGIEGNGILWGGAFYLIPAASPGYLAEWSAEHANLLTSKLIIAGHPVRATTVTVQDYSGGYGRRQVPKSTENVATMVDLRGNTVSYVRRTSSTAGGVQIIAGNEYWITWQEGTSGGGITNATNTGCMRGAGEILAYMLQKSGYKVDAGRMAATQVFLDQILLDFVISEQVDPISWAEEHLGTFLPICWRESSQGLYLTILNYAATLIDSVMDLVEVNSTSSAGVPVSRESQVLQSDPREVVNDLTVKYAPHHGEDLLRTLRLCASGVIGNEGVANTAVLGETPSLLCTISQSRYGIQPAILESWVVASATSAGVLGTSYIRWKHLARRALVVSGGNELDALDYGSIITYTDDSLYIASKLAIVTSVSLGVNDVELNIELLD